MSIDDKIITTENLGIDDDIVQINLEKGAELPSSLPLLDRTFRTCFKKNKTQLMVNMENVKYPPTTFIALLVEVTSQARRLGGDVKLMNLSNSARNNLVTFSATTYLSIEDDEEYALQDFDEMVTIIKEKSESKRIPVASKKIKPKGETSSFYDFRVIQGEKIKVKSTIDNLYDICNFVIDLAQKAGFDNREIGKIKVTVYEACLNVVEHAYFSNPDNWIEVTVKYDKEKFIIIIHDWGQGFDFSPAKEYNVEQAVKDRKTGGFGLHIIQRSVDDIKYESDSEKGNRLILIKNLEGTL
jgi:serine/threonine-protein kinase RsbW